MDEVVVKPSSGWRIIDVRELWAYRELLYFLTWRDVKVRYKQAFFGAAWAIVQPLLLMVVFTVFFGRFAAEATGPADVPTPVYFFAGLIPWNLFAQSLTWSSASLVGGSDLVRKVYFPRLIMPLAATGSYVMDFMIALLVLVGLMVAYGIAPNPNIVWLPVFTLIALISALGVGTLLSALNAKYRDFGYTVPFIVQLWLFVSPVMYPATSSFVPEYLRPFYGLNPLAGVIEGFRWALLDAGEPPGLMTGVSAIAAVVLFVVSVMYFTKVERTFADVI